MEFFSFLFSKPTIFSLLGIFSIVIGIPLGIRTSKFEGPNALVSSFVFIFVSIGLIGLITDRILILFFSQNLLITCQAILVISIIMTMKYKRRKLIIHANSTKIRYFVLIENKGGYENTKLSYSFPFSKKLKIKSSVNLYNPELVDLKKIKLTPRRLWGGYSVKTRKIQGCNITFYVRLGFLARHPEIQKSIKKDLQLFFGLELDNLNFS